MIKVIRGERIWRGRARTCIFLLRPVSLQRRVTAREKEIGRKERLEKERDRSWGSEFGKVRGHRDVYVNATREKKERGPGSVNSSSKYKFNHDAERDLDRERSIEKYSESLPRHASRRESAFLSIRSDT